MKKIISLYKKYEEIINYLIIGGLTTLITLLIFYALTFTILDANNAIELQITNIISWIGAVIFAFFTNKKFVFKSKNTNHKEEGIKFLISRLTTLGLDMLLMFIFVTILKFNGHIMKLLVQIIVIILNYLLSKFLVFKNNN